MQLTDAIRKTVETALYYSRATIDNYWHSWAGDTSESDSLEKLDAALEWLEHVQEESTRYEAYLKGVQAERESAEKRAYRAEQTIDLLKSRIARLERESTQGRSCTPR